MYPENALALITVEWSDFPNMFLKLLTAAHSTDNE